MSQMFLVKNSKGAPVKAYGVNQDITGWKLAQKKLRESEEKLARSKKMESLGLLASGVAHDLNNVLSGIVSYPELLLLDLPADSKLRKPIKTIQESGNKAVAIVQDLLTIARGAATAKEPLNLNMIINEYLDSPEFNDLKRYHPEVKFKTVLESGLFNFSGSLIHIKKVIMNLVSNASEAIEKGGTVAISTSNQYIDMPVSKYEDVNTGEYVVLTISDDGPGISPENLDRIFEPFFTKKVMGKSGTGLGLTVVWNTVQDHSGYIDVKSDKNGTKFELYFPITREETISKASSVSFDDLKGNGELVLVVDDVRSQREISCRMLDSLGYRHVAVPSGEEAIEYLQNNKVDMILLDMIMSPGMSGRETYEEIVKIHPGQKAVIISGYTETEDVVAIQKLGAGKYVKKPFTLETLGLGIKNELVDKMAPENSDSP
jgi:signal transduction histidine kinase/ActR/RegA family two-component response regulator